MKLSHIIALVSVTATLSLGLVGRELTALAHPDSAEFRSTSRSYGRNRGNLLEQLDLSFSQEQQLQNIKDQYGSQLDSRREKLMLAREKLREMMGSNASPDEIRQQHKEVINLGEELANLQLENMLAIREVLTLSQRQELNDLMNQGRSRGRFPGDRP